MGDNALIQKWPRLLHPSCYILVSIVWIGGWARKYGSHSSTLLTILADSTVTRKYDALNSIWYGKQ